MRSTEDKYDPFEHHYRERNIKPQVIDLMTELDLPYGDLGAPVALRTYPPDLYLDGMRGNDFRNPRYYCEEFQVSRRFFSDMEELEQTLRAFDRSRTIFLFYAAERYKLLTHRFPSILDAMSYWVELPKVYVSWKVFDETDEEWCQKAEDVVAKRKGRKGR